MAHARRVGIVLSGLLVLALSAPTAVAQDRDEPTPSTTLEFEPRNETGSRWQRRSVSKVTLALGPEEELEYTIELRRNVESTITVRACPDGRLRAWNEQVSTAEALTGEAEKPVEEWLTTTDPIAGTTLGYRYVQDAFRARRISGPDSRLLRSYLSIPHASVLRDTLLPRGKMQVGEARTASDEASALIAFVTPVWAEPIGKLDLTLEGVHETADTRVARLSGMLRLRISERAPTVQPVVFETEAHVTLDVDVNAGHVVRLGITGAGVAQAQRGKLELPLRVGFEITEDFTLLPGTVAPDAMQEIERLEPVFDDRDWTLAFEAWPKDQTIAEWVTDGEKVEAWTELVTVQSIPIPVGVRLAQVLGALQKRHAATEPNTRWTVLHQTQSEVLYEWTLTGSKRSADQRELARMVLGDARVLLIRYTTKKPSLSADDRRAWIGRLKGARHVGGASRTEPEPEPEPEREFADPDRSE